MSLQIIYALEPRIVGCSDMSAIGFYNWYHKIKSNKRLAKDIYRKLIVKWHPDRNNDDKATEMSQIIISSFKELL